jgi:energy-coupling factor transport system ATP-binding protein
MKLEIQNLSFRYDGVGGSDRFVLSDITLKIANREFLAIVGPSGSGKTTLIQQFTGLLRPTSGHVLVDNDDIWRKGYKKSELRQRIGLVFQFPETQLFEETVCADVAFGPKNLRCVNSETKARVTRALDAVGLDVTSFGGRSPYRLSEGEKRRVAIAGVLAMEPEMVVLDEPTAGLDPKGVHRIEAMLTNLNQNDRAVVVITHNMDFVMRCAQRVVVLSKGKVCFDGTPWHLFCQQELLKNADLELPQLIAAWQKLRGKSKRGHDLRAGDYKTVDIDEKKMEEFILTVRKQ